MSLLTPLGLLGLLSIIVLIIIYIIKPNYQQKFVSSTFIWKLSLKYRKKKIPTNKIRNILLILCQVFILAACAAILAQPVQIIPKEKRATEVIAILDSSASMRTEYKGKTRFERAVEGVRSLSNDMLEKNGLVSVIIAEENPSFMAQRIATEKEGMEATEKLNALLETDACSYSTSNIEAAINLCEEVLVANPEAQIHLFTDTAYSFVPENVKLVNVSKEEEWNVGILDAYTEMEDNYYKFIVDVGCYGNRTAEISVTLSIIDANARSSEEKGENITLTTEPIPFGNNETKRIIFINEDQYQGLENQEENVVYHLITNTDERVYAYQSVQVSLGMDDSFSIDNNFSIYNGQKEVLRIQYASELPNPFFTVLFEKLREIYASKWDLQIEQLKMGEEGETHGFDFYIFEHRMPKKMPTDGVVFLLNPDPSLSDNRLPADSGLQATGINEFRRHIYLTKEKEHPILNHMNVEDITVYKLVNMLYDPDYEVLWWCESQPALLVKDLSEEEASGVSKVVVMPFSLHDSNITMTKEYPVLFYNIMEYFLPSTVQQNTFEVGENVELNARGKELSMLREGDDKEKTVVFNEFPNSMIAELPGTYTLSQTTYSGKSVTEKIFVKVPAEESNIFKVDDAIKDLYQKEQDEINYNDLLLYIAAALVAVLFIEWWLQSRENM